jgi:uncharacterized membrane protein
LPFDAFSPDNLVAFKEFVLVPHGEKGYNFGFLTGEVALQREGGETEPLVAVYVPTNHLYLGDIMLVRREDIIRTRLTIPQGIQIVLSGGISIPQPDRKLETGAAGTGQAGGARDPKKPEPGTTTQGEPDGDRDATTSGGAGQAESSGF